MKCESLFYHFHSREGISKCCLPKWQPFCSGGDELMTISFHSTPGRRSTVTITSMEVANALGPNWFYDKVLCRYCYAMNISILQHINITPLADRSYQIMDRNDIKQCFTSLNLYSAQYNDNFMVENHVKPAALQWYHWTSMATQIAGTSAVGSKYSRLIAKLWGARASAGKCWLSI